MHRLTGIAQNVRHTIHVSAGGSQTDHLALFEIDGTRLCFRGRAPVSIKEGDDMAVVWEPGEKGIHTVLAFHNRTLDVRDHDVRPGGCTGCGCGTGILAVAMVAAAAYGAYTGQWTRVALALGILAILLVVHLIGRATERERDEKLRQVNELLDAPDAGSLPGS